MESLLLMPIHAFLQDAIKHTDHQKQSPHNRSGTHRKEPYTQKTKPRLPQKNAKKVKERQVQAEGKKTVKKKIWTDRNPV